MSAVAYRAVWAEVLAVLPHLPDLAAFLPSLPVAPPFSETPCRAKAEGVDLAADPPPADGPRVKTKLTLDRSLTSRSRLVARVKRLDLTNLPRDVRVELQVGDAVVSQAIPVRSNRRSASAENSVALAITSPSTP